MYHFNILDMQGLTRTFSMVILLVILLISSSLQAQDEYIRAEIGAFGFLHYTRDFENLTAREVEDIMLEYPDAYYKFKKARSLSAMGWAVYLGGVVAMFASMDYAYDFYDNSSAAPFYIGLTSTLAGSIMVLVARNQKTKAVNLYNRQLKKNKETRGISLDLSPTQNGIGLVMKF